MMLKRSLKRTESPIEPEVTKHLEALSAWDNVVWDIVENDKIRSRIDDLTKALQEGAHAIGMLQGLVDEDRIDIDPLQDLMAEMDLVFTLDDYREVYISALVAEGLLNTKLKDIKNGRLTEQAAASSIRSLIQKIKNLFS